MPFKPDTAKPDRLEAHRMASQRLADVARKYAEQVERSAGRFTENVEYARLDLCDAIILLIDDGDALAERRSICHELRIDEEGFQLDDEGGRPIGAERVYIPAGWNHG